MAERARISKLTVSVPVQDIFVRHSSPKISLNSFESPNSALHCLLSLLTSFVAESKGFEPLEPFKVRQFSKLLPSTTRPTLRIFSILAETARFDSVQNLFGSYDSFESNFQNYRRPLRILNSLSDCLSPLSRCSSGLGELSTPEVRPCKGILNTLS